MNINKQMLEQLMEIGFVAGWRGHWSQARSIFSALRAFCPENEGPLIGMGLTLLNAGRRQDAIRLLERALEINPKNDTAMCFLGLAWKSSGSESNAQRCLEQVVEWDRDPGAVRLSRIILGLENAASAPLGTF